MEETTPPTPPPVGTPPPPPPPMAPAPPPYPVTPVRAETKSAALAGFLSMFPGLGHLYLGMYQRAFAFAGAFIIGIGMASHGRGGFFGPLIAFIWFFAIIDAVRQAHAINRGYVAESGFAAEAPVVRRPPASGTAALTWGVILVGLGTIWLLDRYVDIDWSFMETWGTPAALILLGLALVISHIRRKRRENAAGVGMPPRSS